MARQSTSWGHAIRALTPEELIAYGGEGHKCAGKCPHRATHENSYSYITGRAGRASSARRPACPEHAKKFATKHGLLQVPTEATPGRPSASQAMMNAALGINPDEGPRATTVATLIAAIAARYPGLPGRLGGFTVACRACEAPMTDDPAVTGGIGHGHAHPDLMFGCVQPLPAPIHGWSASNRPIFRWQPREERELRPAGARFWWETFPLAVSAS